MNKVTPVFIDWVTATGSENFMGSWLQKNLSYQSTQSIPRAYHRQLGTVYQPSGIRMYFTPEAKDVPAVTVLDGQCLAHIRREYGLEGCTAVVNQLARVSDHFTRVDLTVDIMDSGKFATRFYDDFSAEYLVCSAKFPRRKATLMKSSGTSVYIGSRQSPLMLRVYDKNAESKGKIPATRIELEIKGDTARWLHKTMKTGFAFWTASPTFTTLMYRFSTWQEWPTVEAILTGEVVQVEKVETEPLMDTKEWLRRQVLPTFVRDYENSGRELWNWFVDTLEEQVGAI